MQRRIAVIPARAGSKRIPHKNIWEFNGKPMIVWTIEAAKNSRLFDRIIVSTDCEQTEFISRLYGVEVDIRPEHLATDETPIIDVVRHIADGFDGTVALLYAASPMLTGEIIKEACAIFESGRNDSPLLATDENCIDAGMFCFYHGEHIHRGNFRFYEMINVVDINTFSDWERADLAFKTLKGKLQ